MLFESRYASLEEGSINKSSRVSIPQIGHFVISSFNYIPQRSHEAMKLVLFESLVADDYEHPRTRRFYGGLLK